MSIYFKHCCTYTFKNILSEIHNLKMFLLLYHFHCSLKSLWGYYIPCFSSIKNATYKFRLGHITFMAICQVDIECTKLSFILFCRIKFSNSWTNSIFNEHKIHTNIKRFIFKPISHTKPSLCKPCSTHKYTWSRMGQTLPGLSRVPPPTAPNPNPTYTRKSFKKGLPKLSNPTTHT